MDNWKIGIIKAGIPLPVTDPPQKWSEQWSYQIYAKAQAIGKVDWGETLHVALNSLDIYYTLMQGFLKIIEVSEHNDVRGIWKKMSKASFTGGYGITTGTISAIDIALWNLKARESSLSLSHCLAERREMPKDMPPCPGMTFGKKQCRFCVILWIGDTQW